MPPQAPLCPVPGVGAAGSPGKTANDARLLHQVHPAKLGTEAVAAVASLVMLR